MYGFASQSHMLGARVSDAGNFLPNSPRYLRPQFLLQFYTVPIERPKINARLIPPLETLLR